MIHIFFEMDHNKYQLSLFLNIIVIYHWWMLMHSCFSWPGAPGQPLCSARCGGYELAQRMWVLCGYKFTLRCDIVQHIFVFVRPCVFWCRIFMQTKFIWYFNLKHYPKLKHIWTMRLISIQLDQYSYFALNPSTWSLIPNQRIKNEAVQLPTLVPLCEFQRRSAICCWSLVEMWGRSLGIPFNTFPKDMILDGILT